MSNPPNKIKPKKSTSSSSNWEKIKELEERISKTKYNKKTQHAIGLYKAQIAKLKSKEVQKAKGKGKQTGYVLKKTGDATVILLGFPSVGKSTLLNQITNAESQVGAYDFTTLDVVPGLLKHNYASIQIFDVPGILGGAASGKGRGKEVLSVIRSADMLIIMIDALKPGQCKTILKEVYETNVRLNQEKPYVKISKKPKGGISVGSTVKLSWLDKQTIQDILREFKITNADVLIRTDITPDQLIDVIEGNKKYMPALIVLNKIDLLSPEEKEKLQKELKPDIMISANQKINLEDLKQKVYDKLGLTKIFLKEVNKKPDLEEPLILEKNPTIQDVCIKIHKDFLKKFRFAKIWGNSAKFPGQMQGLTHVLKDGDIVELHLK
ncbi:OBG GTPase family GTP-binding protein [Nanoarchaeota archaeon]